MIDALNGYLYFVTIVEQGSITKASRALSIPKSKLSRRLAQLEQQLGSQLLIRTTRKQQLTESGLLLYQACKPHVEALNVMESLVHDKQNKIKGKLSLLLPLEFFNKVISALITEFAFKYPDIEIHCHHYSDAYPEFDHQYDLVFVLHEKALPTSHWIGKTLLSFPQSIYACENSQLADNNNTVEELLIHKAITASESEQWLFRHNNSVQVFTPNIAMVLTSNEMRLEACQRGMGIVKLPDYIAKNNHKIKAISVEHNVMAQQLTILFQSRNIPAKTRTFIDYFQSKLGCLTND
ncbi:LysR family transcriptional regulator [Thalassotalea castellviae]|uniref:LysR family transcriptional regulator n=1 Tax=Thalassotalea castellviae TaxID=3075612 RepID=A0ABU3A1P1_9GAMM|nr:LysR family transcriptional regulator [Thalassotalea sp. W431]MDT0603013.1 LysR family transcriptional regulator [Thalassotalea sp. W431]